jgi:hypothetical protein
MTPTRTSRGRLSAKACSPSVRLTRWSARCAVTSSGSSTLPRRPCTSSRRRSSGTSRVQVRIPVISCPLRLPRPCLRQRPMLPAVQRPQRTSSTVALRQPPHRSPHPASLHRRRPATAPLLRLPPCPIRQRHHIPHRHRRPPLARHRRQTAMWITRSRSPALRAVCHTAPTTITRLQSPRPRDRIRILTCSSSRGRPRSRRAARVDRSTICSRSRRRSPGRWLALSLFFSALIS